MYLSPFHSLLVMCLLKSLTAHSSYSYGQAKNERFHYAAVTPLGGKISPVFPILVQQRDFRMPDWTSEHHCLCAQIGSEYHTLISKCKYLMLKPSGAFLKWGFLLFHSQPTICSVFGVSDW